ncbi:hypothetical protein [Bacillus sp. REN16]|uniref:hypothetical protein n=1 Tax=Bacillus sp. REN16 TaxID=2887296 RepID=UPI001E58D3E8|nr:hypothetical protein [Bacillus sp. REN16]MCC3358598.1 hypothetical protein [Bacillus sp. REN16]
MRKRIAIAIIMFVAIMSFSATVAHSHAFKSSDIQENTLTISGVSYDNPSFHDDGKLKISWVLFSITSFLIVLQGMVKNIDVDPYNRKFVWITPIFYQSNYVIKTL